jgi:hypothetical protein
MFIDPSVALGEAIGAPGKKNEPISLLRKELEREYYEWWAENDYLLRVGLPGDVTDLRLRLNAAFVKACNSSRVAPKAS